MHPITEEAYAITGVWITIILFVTFPIWVIPFFIHQKIRGKI